MKKITFVSGDDWKGLYVDGKLVYENHSIPNYIVLDKLGIDYDEIEADLDWLDKVGCLPEKLSQVKEQK